MKATCFIVVLLVCGSVFGQVSVEEAQAKLEAKKHLLAPATQKVATQPTTQFTFGIKGVSLNELKKTADFKDKNIFPKIPGGVVITHVTPGGSAATAGLQAGDVLIDIGGYSTSDVQSLLKWAKTAKVGMTYPLSVFRVNSANVWKQKTLTMKALPVTPETLAAAAAAEAKDAKTEASASPQPETDNEAKPANEQGKKVSETPLEGFWGMPFGTSMDECKQIMLAKDGATLDDKEAHPNTLIVDGVTFGGFDAEFVMLKFYEGKLCAAIVEFKPPQNDLELKIQFDNVKEMIDKKYYVVKCDRIFLDPYRDGDGYEFQAVKVGKAFIGSQWDFQPKVGTKTDHIDLSFDTVGRLNVKVVYVNAELATKSDAKKQQKRAEDF